MSTDVFGQKMLNIIVKMTNYTTQVLSFSQTFSTLVGRVVRADKRLIPTIVKIFAKAARHLLSLHLSWRGLSMRNDYYLDSG